MADHLAGEKASGVKLAAAQVEDIRRLHAAGGFSVRKLARRFSVSPQTIANVVNHKTWRESC